jgi:hypothetical protein
MSAGQTRSDSRGRGRRQAGYGDAEFHWDKHPFSSAYHAPTIKGGGDELESQVLVGADDFELMDGRPEGYQELGFSFKKLAKGIGKGLKKVGKVAISVGKVAAFVIPGGTAVLTAAAGADSLLKAATKGSKKARNAIKATALLAKKGDPEAVRALAVLKEVHSQRKADGVKPGQATPALAKHSAALKKAAPSLQRVHNVKPKTSACACKPAEETGFFVDLQGRTQARGKLKGR